jgi:hypothetical protein
MLHFWCILSLTSTGAMPQIDTCKQELSPKLFLRLVLGCKELLALALPQPDGYDPCPGRFTGSRPMRSLPVGAIPYVQQ